MGARLNIIPTSNLSINDVPYSRNLEKIFSFALTFDPNELEGLGVNMGTLDEVSEKSTLHELRAHLYFEQRRWNHFGRYPDENAETQLRKIVELIRKRFQ